MIQFPNQNNKVKYDLEERVARFAEQIIDFFQNLSIFKGQKLKIEKLEFD